MSTPFERRVKKLRERVLGNQKANTGSQFDKLTVPELKELAKEKGIEGYSNMTKANLIESLTALDEVDPDDD